MLKILFIQIFLFTTLYSSQNLSLFKTNYTFFDLSANYLDWNTRTQNSASKKDFTYLEIEGGAGWEWGEFYGFIDIENPTHSYNDLPTNDLRVTVKPIFDIYVKDGFNIHIQDFHLQSESFYINNFIIGISYKYISNDAHFWFTPFIAPHYQTSTYFSGFNGYMAGWVFNYDFKIFGEELTLFNWNEIEFARDKADYQLSDGTLIGNEKSYGINGALSFWWSINTHFKPGFQYRYAKYKLGSKELQSAFIYSLKYYF